MAEFKAKVDALKAVIYQTTEEYVAGRDATMLASMCKLKVG